MTKKLKTVVILILLYLSSTVYSANITEKAYMSVDVKTGGVLIEKNADKKITGLPFFVVGSLVGFFDSLMFPLLAFGIGIIIMLLNRARENNGKNTIKSEIIYTMKVGFLWLLGYGLTWASKWLVVDLIYHKGIIMVALKQALFRISGSIEYINEFGNTKITVIDSILANVNLMVLSIMCIVVFAIFVIVYRLIYPLNNKNTSGDYIYLIVAFLPILRFIIIKNHSYQHAIFVQKELLITVVSFLIFLV